MAATNCATKSSAVWRANSRLNGRTATASTPLAARSSVFIAAVVRRYADDATFKKALDRAPPGIMDARSWVYWNIMADRYPAPPMPRRSFGEDAELSEIVRERATEKGVPVNIDDVELKVAPPDWGWSAS